MPSAHRVGLVRHGQTEWSESGRHTSTTDVPLTATGRAQATTVPAVLSGLGIRPGTVWCSPRQRSRATAEIAGLTVTTISDDLVEWDYGDYEGLTTPQIRTDRLSWDLFRDGCPGGESPAQVCARADRALAGISGALPNGDVIVVCHGHISRVLAVRWVGLPVTAAAGIAMDAAAVTVLGEHHGEPIIRHANVVPLSGEREQA